MMLDSVFPCSSHAAISVGRDGTVLQDTWPTDPCRVAIWDHLLQ